MGEENQPIIHGVGVNLCVPAHRDCARDLGVRPNIEMSFDSWNAAAARSNLKLLKYKTIHPISTSGWITVSSGAVSTLM
jgi:hypothetical protein